MSTFPRSIFDEKELDNLDELDREIYTELQSWRKDMRDRFWELILESKWVQARVHSMWLEEHE
jgi:hypothetical protein